MSTRQEWILRLDELIERFVDGRAPFASFKNEFREEYLGGSPAWELDDVDQLFFDRVLETLDGVGVPGDRLHDDERLADERAYRDYVSALQKPRRDGSLTIESPEY